MTWYLRTRYVDPQRDDVRERHYLDNGEIWVLVRGERELLGRLDPIQVDAARSAVVRAQLDELVDIPAVGADLAVMTYEWNLPGSAGRWVDAAYPVALPARVDELEETLLALEEHARP